MTAIFRRSATCKKCETQVPLEDDFSAWIRCCRELDSADGYVFMDKDLIVHRYKTTHGRGFQCLMFVEVKVLGADASPSQRDTMWIVDQMFRTTTTTPTKKDRRHIGKTPKKVKSVIGGDVHVKAYGYHLLRMGGCDPIKSQWIEWDSKRITLVQLVQLLQFDIDPDTFHKLTFRIHHKRENYAVLFE